MIKWRQLFQSPSTVKRKPRKKITRSYLKMMMRGKGRKHAFLKRIAMMIIMGSIHAMKMIFSSTSQC